MTPELSLQNGLHAPTTGVLEGMIKLHQTVAEIAHEIWTFPFRFRLPVEDKMEDGPKEADTASQTKTTWEASSGERSETSRETSPGRRTLHPKPDRRQAGRQDKTGDKLGLEASQERGQSAQTKTKTARRRTR